MKLNMIYWRYTVCLVLEARCKGGETSRPRSHNAGADRRAARCRVILVEGTMLAVIGLAIRWPWSVIAVGQEHT